MHSMRTQPTTAEQGGGGNRLPAPSRNDLRSYNHHPAVEGALPLAGATPLTLCIK